MSIRDRAIEAIRDLPDDASIDQIMRQVSLIAGMEQAMTEIDRGEGLTAEEAKERFKQCLTK